MNHTSFWKLLLRLWIWAYFVLWALEIFGFWTSQITNFLSSASWQLWNLNLDNSFLFEIFRSWFVILWSFLIAGFLTSYSAFALAILCCFAIWLVDKNLLLILTPLVAIVFLWGWKYSLDYLFGKKSKYIKNNFEEQNIVHTPQKPLEISKPHIEHKKSKIQVVTKTKNWESDDWKTIIEI